MEFIGFKKNKTKTLVSRKSPSSYETKPVFVKELLNENANIILFLIRLLSNKKLTDILQRNTPVLNSIDYLDYEKINIEKIINYENEKGDVKGKQFLIDLIEWFVLEFNDNWLIIDILHIIQNVLTHDTFKQTNASQKLNLFYDEIKTYMDGIKKDENEKKNIVYEDRHALLFIIYFVYLLKYEEIEGILENYNSLLNQCADSLNCIIDSFLQIFIKKDNVVSDLEKNNTINIIKYFIELSVGKYNEKNFASLLNLINESIKLEQTVVKCETQAIIDVFKLLGQYSKDIFSTIVDKSITILKKSDNNNNLTKIGKNLSKFIYTGNTRKERMFAGKKKTRKTKFKSTY